MKEQTISVRRRVLAWCERVYGSSTLTFSGIVAIVLPLFVDQLFLCGINFLNTTMISGYGATAVAAVGMVDSLNNLVVNFFIAVATGCTVLVAQFCGKGDRHTANQVAAQAVGLSAYISLSAAALMLLFAPKIVGLLFGGAEQAILDQALVYLRGGVLSYPFLAVMQSILGAMRGSGNTRTSLYFSLFVNILYVLGNAITLYVLRIGVLGMGISLVVSRSLTAGLALLYMIRSNGDFRPVPRDFLRMNGALQRPLLRVAAPSALEQVLFHGGRMATQVIIVGFGTMSIAANTVCMPISSMQQVIGNALALAIVPVAGQCIGAHRLKQAKRYVKRMTLTAMAGLALSSLIMAPLIPFILSRFQLDPEGYEKARMICTIFLIGTPILWPTSFVVPAGLRAAGDSLFTSIAAMSSMWIFRVGMAWVFGVLMGWDVYGVWLAMVLEWGVRSALFLSRLHGSHWYRHRLV